ncbi:hypothetical protein OEZ85_009391 [Tetradesmus obliquus]|uniref:50S ribosomal protein L28 n=1 Tax=Tetradesmus obliquus TaxID=3088 RepID=A0ABY8U8T9_TETOB|nr:hypothetical protein OEZ85_009391 [Tetradesmus obliquus]
MPHPVGYVLRAVSHIPAKARKSLYAGKRIDVANRVSSDYEVRSRVIRKPNVVKRRLYSQALGEKLQLNVTTTALRAIDRAGGLDRYLLKTPDSLLYSDLGSDLKFKIGLLYRHKWHEQRQQQQGQQQQGQQQLQLPGAAAAAKKAAAQLAGGGRRSKSLLPPAAAAALEKAAEQSQ